MLFSVSSDLDFFIRFESWDRIRRQGDSSKRRVPMADEYARYQFKQGKVADVSQRPVQESISGGYPVKGTHSSTKAVARCPISHYS
jgi:hypothetical protein